MMTQTRRSRMLLTLLVGAAVAALAATPAQTDCPTQSNAPHCAAEPTGADSSGSQPGKRPTAPPGRSTETDTSEPQPERTNPQPERTDPQPERTNPQPERTDPQPDQGGDDPGGPAPRSDPEPERGPDPEPERGPERGPDPEPVPGRDPRPAPRDTTGGAPPVVRPSVPQRTDGAGPGAGGPARPIGDEAVDEDTSTPIPPPPPDLGARRILQTRLLSSLDGRSVAVAVAVEEARAHGVDGGWTVTVTGPSHRPGPALGMGARATRPDGEVGLIIGRAREAAGSMGFTVVGQRSTSVYDATYDGMLPVGPFPHGAPPVITVTLFQ